MKWVRACPKWLVTPLCVLAAACAFALVGGSVTSKLMWNYPFARPAPPFALHQLSAVRSVASVETNEFNGSLEASPEESWDGYFHRDSEFPYYFLEGRSLQILKEKRHLPSSSQAPVLSLRTARNLIDQTGILAKPEANYRDSDRLSGVIIDGVTDRGERVVVMALRGGQVSNDHYPFYELVFRGKGNDDSLRYESGQMFFFDIAGLEGAEGVSLFLAFGYSALLFIIPGVTLIHVLRWIASRRTWTNDV